MNKKFLLAYLCITTISIIGAIVFGVLYYDPDNFAFPDGHNFHRVRSDNPYQKYEAHIRTEHRDKNGSIPSPLKIIGGIGALVLLGYLLVMCYQKYMMDSKADSEALANALHKLSLESNRTEYELFVIAAKEWSIPETQIEKDFRNYMGANVLPYYVMDLVRKNNERICKSIEKDKKVEIKLTYWWDLVKALLLFPGCFLIPFILIIILRPYFSHNF